MNPVCDGAWYNIVGLDFLARADSKDWYPAGVRAGVDLVGVYEGLLERDLRSDEERPFLIARSTDTEENDRGR